MTVDRCPVDRSRRRLLGIGALALAGGAASSGCGSDEPAPDVQPDPGGEDRIEGQDASRPQDDVSLVNTALSVEVLAVDMYQQAFDLGLVESSTVTEAAALFQQQHRAHRELLVVAVEAAGGEPFTTANPVVKAALVDPSIASVTVEGELAILARDLEQATAQLYVHITTALTTQELRSLAMSIGAAASRRATVLDLLGDLGNERLAQFPTENPLPSDAIVAG